MFARVPEGRPARVLLDGAAGRGGRGRPQGRPPARRARHRARRDHLAGGRARRHRPGRARPPRRDPRPHRQALDRAPRAVAVHRAPRARDRGRLRALRHRSQGAGRHPGRARRRPGSAPPDRARPGHRQVTHEGGPPGQAQEVQGRRQVGRQGRGQGRRRHAARRTAARSATSPTPRTRRRSPRIRPSPRPPATAPSSRRRRARRSTIRPRSDPDRGRAGGDQPPPARAAAPPAPAEPPAATTPAAPPPRRSPRPAAASDRDADGVLDSPDANGEGDVAPRVDPYTGRFRTVMQLLRRKKIEQAISAAAAWRAESPGDVMALVALGEALEAARRPRRAPRAPTARSSICSRARRPAPLRRRAARAPRRPGAPWRWPPTPTPAPPSSAPITRRATACSRSRCVKQGKHAEAFAAPRARPGPAATPTGRFRGVRRSCARTWAWSARPGSAPSRPAPRRSATRLRKAGGTARERAVDALRPQLGDRRQRRRLPHPRRQGGHAFYSQPKLASGGSSTPTSPPATAPSASPSAARARAAPTRTGSRRTTTRAARWATAWASSRSSSTTARATSASRSAPS